MSDSKRETRGEVPLQNLIQASRELLSAGVRMRLEEEGPVDLGALSRLRIAEANVVSAIAVAARSTEIRARESGGK